MSDPEYRIVSGAPFQPPPNIGEAIKSISARLLAAVLLWSSVGFVLAGVYFYNGAAAWGWMTFGLVYFHVLSWSHWRVHVWLDRRFPPRPRLPL